MRDHSRPHGRTASDDILNYAMFISILVVAGVTTLLITTNLEPITTIIAMSIIGGIWTFTITPAIVALWLGTDIQTLLNIPDSKYPAEPNGAKSQHEPPEAPSEHHETRNTESH